MAKGPLLVCVYPQQPTAEAEVRELCQSAARHGFAVQAASFADQGSPRRNAAAWPRCLSETLRGGSGPWLVVEPTARVTGPLERLTACLDQVDLAVPFRGAGCATQLFDPGLMLLRGTPATADFLADWAARSARWAAGHRFGHAATLLESLLAVAERLRWRAIDAGSLTGLTRTRGAAEADELPLVRDAEAQSLPTSADAAFVIEAPPSPASLGAGTAEDFKEYAARHGINQVWTLGAAVAVEHRAMLEGAKLELWQAVARRMPLSSRLVVADYDTLLIENPRSWAVALDAADVVVAWDAASPLATPFTGLIGLSSTPRLESVLWPAVTERFTALLAERGPRDALAEALGSALRSVGDRLRIATLPEVTCRRRGPLSPETMVLAVDQLAAWLTGRSPAVIGGPAPTLDWSALESSTLALA